MNRRGFLHVIGIGSLGSALLPGMTTTSKKDIIKPAALQKGDTVGLISPASRLHNPSNYDKVVSSLKDLGYQVKEGKHARKNYGYFSGRDQERADDLNAMFADDSIDAIMTFRGGWGSNRILDLIDYQLIRENPKILVGYSDITSLLLAIHARTGLITFHGPVGNSEWTDFTIKHFNKILGKQNNLTLQTIEDDICEDCNEFLVINSGQAEGRLLGGNLTVLTSMLGSEFLPDWKGNILLLEDVGEDVYRIDRMLTQLKLNNVLDQISGLIFGQCTNCERANSYSLTLNQVFEDHIKPLGIPAFSGALIGHIDNMITFPVGMPAVMNAQEGTIKLKSKAVQ